LVIYFRFVIKNTATKDFCRCVFNHMVGGLINQYALTPLIFQNESVFYTLTAPQSYKTGAINKKNNDINADAGFPPKRRVICRTYQKPIKAPNPIPIKFKHILSKKQNQYQVKFIIKNPPKISLGVKRT